MITEVFVIPVTALFAVSDLLSPDMMEVLFCPICLFIDGSVVKAHQHVTGSQGDEPQTIGKSVAGNRTKIHLSVDSCDKTDYFLNQKVVRQ